MLKVVYCDRPGCGKEVGAQRIENNKIVEEEYVEGHCTMHEVNEELDITKTLHFCSEECRDNKDEFLGPEEIEDE